MDNLFFVVCIPAFIGLNLLLTGCLDKRTRVLERRIKALEDKPQATAPYLPPLQPAYARPVYTVVPPRPSAPPVVPLYQAQPSYGQAY